MNEFKLLMMSTYLRTYAHVLTTNRVFASLWYTTI